MTEAVDGETGKTYRYTYDEMGNILTARTHTVSASGSETMVVEKTYRYENGIFSGYTAKGSMPITYETDAMGNPIQIGNGLANTTLIWGEGRMLTGIRRNAKNHTPTPTMPMVFGQQRL
ncbi:MAG: hypothetical protein ACI3V3_00665 [Faecousia sp.]